MITMILQSATIVLMAAATAINLYGWLWQRWSWAMLWLMVCAMMTMACVCSTDLLGKCCFFVVGVVSAWICMVDLLCDYWLRREAAALKALDAIDVYGNVVTDCEAHHVEA